MLSKWYKNGWGRAASLCEYMLMRTTLALPDDLDRARGLGRGCGFRAFALYPEPPGLDRYLAEWADGLGRGHWTDADLTEVCPD